MSNEAARSRFAVLAGASLFAALMFAGCASVPRHVAQAHAAGPGPGAAGGLPALTGLRDPAGPPSSRESEARPDRAPAGQSDAAAGAGDSTSKVPQSAPQPASQGVSDPDGAAGAGKGTATGRPAALPLSMVPSRGAARTRVVTSARRLLGVVRSFDERSFLGHVLIINDALPRGESSLAYTAAMHRERARAAGAWVAVEQALPGDVVVFSCRSGCGAGTADGVAAGIVEEFSGGTLRFIAYVDGEVRSCAWGKGGGDATRIRKVDGAVRTWP